MAAWEKFFIDFNPDTYNSPMSIPPGRALEDLDCRLYSWAGHGIGKDLNYQFIEGEYMTADEYEDFIDDPTGFFLNKYFPRIFGSLEHFDKIPLLPPIHELPLIPPGVMPFGMPDVRDSIKKLMDAGSEMLNWVSDIGQFNLKMMGKGIPSMYGGFSKAPFDALGDSLRGTKGIMMDMFKCPEDLLEACERMTPFMIKLGIRAAAASKNPLIFMPLHKGADGFMSEVQFRTFYWPTLRKVAIGLINEGCVPLLFAEGAYNSRLEIVKDLPKGKAIWWFDQTDMARAKEVLGDSTCIAGNVPLSLLCAGSPTEVEAYCKNLIDTAGNGGGFMLSTGAGLDLTKPENVKTMIEFSRNYKPVA
jgi:uroporphyrinogen-III decarboxylase